MALRRAALGRGLVPLVGESRRLVEQRPVRIDDGVGGVWAAGDQGVGA
jgi:hypothetical protein